MKDINFICVFISLFVGLYCLYRKWYKLTIFNFVMAIVNLIALL